MKKLLLCCMLLIGVMQGSYAQQESMDEVVYLKNGSIVRGMIIEQKPNKSLKIETADGSLFVFEMNEVEKITKEAKVRTDRYAYQQAVIEESNTGLGRRMGMVQFFGLGYQGSYWIDDSSHENVGYFSCHFIYGYQFKQQFFIGGGVGMEHLAGDALSYSYNLRIPVFAAAKINLNKKKVSPFFQFDMGCHFNTDDNTENGFFFHPKFGVDFNLGWSRRKALFLSLSLAEYGIMPDIGYDYSYDSYSSSYSSSYNSHNNYEFYIKLGLNFGLRF